MEIKMNYHYSYFIYPYVVKEQKYSKYIQSLLKNTKCTLKIFEKKKNFSMYNYFLPTIREYMFRSFGFAESNTKALDSLSTKLQANMLTDTPCTIFEYDMGQDTQAKIDSQDSIFFKMQKIEIICFNTGICFLAIKTNLEDTEKFADLLDFNYKFRDINAETGKNSGYNKIKIQDGVYSDVKKLADIIKELTGNPVDSKKIDINTSRFLIYSYVCINEEHWNESQGFEYIKKEFYKFANVLDSNFNEDANNDRLKVVNIGEYSKMGITNSGVTLIASSINTSNYTNLPNNFEGEYFYTYVFELYKKFYLSKLLEEFKNSKKAEVTKEKFLEFTNEIWIHEITNNDDGILMHEDLAEVLELDNIYEKVKRQYDIAYKDYRVKNNEKLNKIILILLIISATANVINFTILSKVLL